MPSEERKFHWIAAFWATALILAIPIALSFLVPVLYGVYVGFQSQGNTALVNERIRELTKSLGFSVFFLISVTVITFWRGYALTKKVSERVRLHIAVAVGLALLVFFPLSLLIGSGNVVASLQQFVIQSMVVLGGAYLGMYIAGRKATNS
jgi:hypothetical protein